MEKFKFIFLFFFYVVAVDTVANALRALLLSNFQHNLNDTH